MAKALTKALHTVRVVRVIAGMVIKQHGMGAVVWSPDALLAAVCGKLGNSEPTDATLLAACRAACLDAING